MLTDLEIIELKLRLVDMEEDLKELEDKRYDVAMDRCNLETMYNQKLCFLITTNSRQKIRGSSFSSVVESLMYDMFEGADNESIEHYKENFEDKMYDIMHNNNEFDRYEIAIDFVGEFFKNGKDHLEKFFDRDVCERLIIQLNTLKQEMIKAVNKFDEEYSHDKIRINALTRKITFLKQTLAEVENRNVKED